MDLNRKKIDHSEAAEIDGYSLKGLVAKYGGDANIFNRGDSWDPSWYICWEEVESLESWRERLLQVIVWDKNKKNREKALKVYQENFPQDELKEI